MIKKCFFSLVILLYTLFTYAQKIASIERVEPLNWWIGFKNKNLQILVYGNNIAQKTVNIHYAGVQLKKVHKVENPNYVFIDVLIGNNTQPGKMPIVFKENGQKDITYYYELKKRTGYKPNTVCNKDFIYLIMPDRFANGDYNNDVVKNMRETSLNRDSMYHRHGGDIQGIINNLNYLEKLGVTTLWLTPVLTNDEPKDSYHGYANTENYHIDPRFGTNELYKDLAKNLHERNMKLVMDVVPNHMGTEHFTNLDKPMKDWVNQWDTFTRSSFHDQPVFDPYAAEIDKKIMTKGWFDYRMADMNQDNPFVATYITQSHIWWIEYAGVDGLRIDTYPYNEPTFISSWAKQIFTEYPTLGMFGEAWVTGVVNEAAFAGGNVINRGIDTKLPGITDFQSLWAIGEAFKPFGFNDGVMKIYNTLAKDFVYQHPEKNVVFLGNHDLSRFLSVVGENIPRMKVATAWLLTTRGIPQWYYGDEILYNGFSNPDGHIRQDFMGGWKEDKENKFTENGRSIAENDMYNYVAKIANFRKQSTALQSGKLMQYLPENGIYVYFRYTKEESVMIIINTNSTPQTLNTQRFHQRLNGFTTAKNIITDGIYTSLANIALPATSATILQLN